MFIQKTNYFYLKKFYTYIVFTTGGFFEVAIES